MPIISLLTFTLFLTMPSPMPWPVLAVFAILSSRLPIPTLLPCFVILSSPCFNMGCFIGMFYQWVVNPQDELLKTTQKISNSKFSSRAAGLWAMSAFPIPKLSLRGQWEHPISHFTRCQRWPANMSPHVRMYTAKSSFLFPCTQILCCQAILVLPSLLEGIMGRKDQESGCYSW